MARWNTEHWVNRKLGTASPWSISTPMLYSAFIPRPNHSWNGIKLGRNLAAFGGFSGFGPSPKAVEGSAQRLLRLPLAHWLRRIQPAAPFTLAFLHTHKPWPTKPRLPPPFPPLREVRKRRKGGAAGKLELRLPAASIFLPPSPRPREPPPPPPSTFLVCVGGEKKSSCCFGRWRAAAPSSAGFSSPTWGPLAVSLPRLLPSLLGGGGVT